MKIFLYLTSDLEDITPILIRLRQTHSSGDLDLPWFLCVVYVVLANYSWVWDLTCSVVEVPSDTPLEKTFSLPNSYQFANSFLGRVRALYLLPLLLLLI